MQIPCSYKAIHILAIVFSIWEIVQKYLSELNIAWRFKKAVARVMAL